AEAVAEARGDHGESRAQLREQGLAARGARAVVTDLQHVDAADAPRQAGLGVRLCVAREQERPPPEADPEHERVVVRVVAGIEAGTGPYDLDEHAAERPRWAAQIDGASQTGTPPHERIERARVLAF